MQLRELTAVMCKECVKKGVNWESEVMVYWEGKPHQVTEARAQEGALLLQIDPHEYTNETSPSP
jgi:hypothetical protein